MSRKQSIIALHVGAFLWAFASTLLGPALPLITDELRLGYSAGGSIFTLSSAGFLAGSLLVASAFRRFGLRALVLVSAGTLLPLLYLTSLVPSFPLLLVTVGVTGVAGGALTTLVNAGVSDLASSTRAASLSLLNVSFGLGALLAPLFAGLVISRTGDWKPMYQFTCVLVLGLLLLAALSLPASTATATATASTNPWRALLNRAGVIAFTTVFLAAAVEWGFAYWAATYFNDVVGAGKALAANMAALFWAGMLTGRLAFGSLLRTADPRRTVTVCAIAAIAAGVILAVNAGVVVSVVGAVALGASLAAIIPSLLALAIDARPHDSGTISGILMFASGGGSLTAPAVVGIVAEQASLVLAVWAFPVLALLLMAVHVAGSPATALGTATVGKSKD